MTNRPVHHLTLTGQVKSKTLMLASLLISAVVVLFLIWLIYFKNTTSVEHSWVNYLPWCNALFNSICTYHLVRGFVDIRARRLADHRQHMLWALTFSCLFLLSYTSYHYLHGDTKFPTKYGFIRSLYLIILASHIGLSIIALPIILLAFALAFAGKFTLHPKFARLALPLWLYVSVTGVIIVIFLKIFT